MGLGVGGWGVGGDVRWAGKRMVRQAGGQAAGRRTVRDSFIPGMWGVGGGGGRGAGVVG